MEIKLKESLREKKGVEETSPVVKVAIIQRQIPHYRIPFFTEIYSRALDVGMDVTIYCVKAPDSRIPGNFRYKVLPSRYPLGPQSGPYWLKGLTEAVNGSDIIIAPLELQGLNIIYLWAMRGWFCKCWIWWGHGYSFQSSWRTDRLFLFKEAIKRFMVPRSRGLITYTEGGARYWHNRNLPKERVIPFFNTLHVEGLRKTVDTNVEEYLITIKRQLRLEGKRVLLFSGRLYREKKVDFLLRAIALLQRDHPDVALLILGDGPERESLERLSSEMNLQSVYFLGEVVEPERTSPYFLISELLVIPGLVGLAIIHGFTFGLPLVTTKHGFHSLEIEYLSEETGIMTEHEESAYAEALGKLLSSPVRLEAMRQKAILQADQLLLTDSVERFINGVRLLARIG